MSDYPNAESVDIEVRMTALRYVLDCVKNSYGADDVALRNVAALVDGVADAVFRDDGVSALVLGTRLLDTAEVNHIVGLFASTLRTTERIDP